MHVRRIALLLLVIWLTSACAGQGSVEPPSSPPGTPVLDEGELLSYRREGGIAGFCERVVVTEVSARVEPCGGAPRELALDARTTEELDRLAERYAPLVREMQDNPGGPDNLTRELRFNGRGDEPLPPEIEQQLVDLAERLFAGAGELTD